MPDHELESAEIEALIAFIADGGPDTAPAFLTAASASESDVAEGRMIFFDRRDASAVACASCHSLRSHEGRFTQSLGGSLGHVFTRYHDAELARQLEVPVTQPVNGNCRRVPLDAEDAFFLRAFLYRVDQQSIAAEASPLSLPKAGLATALALFLIVQLGSGWRPHLRPGRRHLAHLDPLA
jgi:hypothetical protein